MGKSLWRACSSKPALGCESRRHNPCRVCALGDWPFLVPMLKCQPRIPLPRWHEPPALDSETGGLLQMTIQRAQAPLLLLQPPPQSLVRTAKMVSSRQPNVQSSNPVHMCPASNGPKLVNGSNGKPIYMPWCGCDSQ